MTDPEVEAGIEGERTVSPGQTLQAERLRREMTVQQVAQDLHLDTWVIDALEADNYSAIGPPVFAKGHLRQYAELLGLEPDELLIGYYQTRETPAEQPVISEVLTRREDSGPSLRWLLIILLAILLAGAAVLGVWFLLLRGEAMPELSPVAETPPAVAPESGVDESAAPTGRESVPRDLPQSEPAAALPEAGLTSDNVLSDQASTDTVSSDSATAVQPSETAITLQFSFAEDSWLEVYDATDTRIYFSLGRKDSVATVSGVPPLRVFLGYADGVSLTVDGRTYPIPHRGTRNTSRFTVTGDE